MSKKKRIEDAYPLSPMQQGMLFHALYAPGSEAYFNQLHCLLEGPLDADLLGRACQRVVDRHAALRTGFLWEGRDQPFQVVARKVRLPWQVVDWSDLEPAPFNERLEKYLQTDRARGFDLARPPLLRGAVISGPGGYHHFVWSNHHLVTDGWCQTLIFQEVFAIYGALLRGLEPTLPAPRPYRDYIAWLLRRDLSEAESFWRSRLAGFTAATRLSGDRAAGRRSDAQGEYLQQELLLDADQTAALGTLARSHELTLSTLVQGLWGLLLSRLSGDGDVVFGTTVAGRPPELPGADAMVGLFINTLPVRLRVDPETPLLAWLGEFQRQQVETRQYEYSPLAEIQRWSEVPTGEPLFETLVVFENLPASRMFSDNGDGTEDGTGSAGGEGGPRLVDLHSKSRVTYPLTLQVVPGYEMILRFKYEAERFSVATVEVMLEQLYALCRQARTEVEQPLGALSLLTPESPVPDLRAALEEPAHAPIPTLWMALAVTAPDRVALVFGEHTWSYGELVARVDDLGRLLLDRGLERGQVVAVHGPRSPGVIMAMMAVLGAGGVLVTLDPKLPAERRRQMLEQTRARLLIDLCSAAGHDEGTSPMETLPVESWSGRPMAPVPDAGGGHPELSADDAAYIFLTSGTSGRPRAILGCHKGLSHFLAWQRQTFGVGPGDRAAQLTALSFDVVLRDIFLPLTSGATLCLPTVDDLGADHVLPFLERDAISLLHTVPTVADSWLVDPPQGISLHRLRQVFFAGEPLTDVLVRRLRRAFPGLGEVINLYGPTETTLAKCWYRVAAEPAPGTQPVGRPLPQTQAPVMAPGGRLCGVGEAGEIVLRTPFRSLGYLDNAALNAEKFVPNPRRDDPQDLLYHTGDRGRLRPDGLLEILGRLDDQIKVRGVRVEPAEVTAVLERHPAVASAVVVGLRDSAGQNALVAYVVPAAGAPFAPEQLRDELAARLPAALVPAVFEALKELPRTRHGKIDRRALPAPRWGRVDAASAYVAPRTPLEEILADIWGQVLRQKQVGSTANFFDLGGHSLLATQVVSRIRRICGVELPLRELFEAPVLADLARRVEALTTSGASAQEAATASAPPPLQPAPRTATLPLSFSQERLWFFDQLEPQSALYNIHTGARLEGPLEPVALAAALAAVVARHEVLRTGFESSRGEARQVVLARLEVTLPMVDLSHLRRAWRERELQRLALEQAGGPFDLAHPPLWRAQVVRLAAREHAVLLSVHHIVADAWSLGLLMREMMQGYRALCRGGEGAPRSPLLPLAVQYGDFAHWQRSWLRGEGLEAELVFWRRYLEGAPTYLELPLDRPRPAVQSFRGARVEQRWPAAELAALQAAARGSGTTLFMLLLAGLQAWLHRATGQDDVLVGTAIAGRNRVEIEPLIGFFVNTLVLRTRARPEPGGGGLTFAKLLDRVRRGVFEAYAHQDLPFDKLVDELTPERSLAVHPLIQVMLVLQNAPPPEPMESELVVHRLENARPNARLDLALSAIDTGNGLLVFADYAVDLFDATTVARLLTGLRGLLRAAVAEPDQSLADLPLLARAQRQQVLVEWNATEHPADGPNLLHLLVREQAEEAPDLLAAIDGERAVTYGELVRRARRLASHLRQLGVGPEVRVALAVHRSLEMLQALLGILEAGGVYVPLDPEYPRERLDLMLADAGVAVLVVDEALSGRFTRDGVPTVALRRRDDLPPPPKAPPPPPPVAPHNLAYTIFTSGSTGRPAGVMVPHRAVCSTLKWRRETFALGPSDRLLQNISLSFDPSVWQIFGPLISGGCLVLARPGGHQDPAYLLSLIARHRVTITDFPPSFLRVLLEEHGLAGASSLRCLFVGGEALPVPLRDAFLAIVRDTGKPTSGKPTRDAPRTEHNLFERGTREWRGGGGDSASLSTARRSIPSGLAGRGLARRGLARRGTTLLNIYGPTEAAIDATVWECDRRSHPQVVPIGRPIANKEVHVLDRDLQPAVFGTEGELCIAGVGLARGYQGRPRRTAARFVPHPTGRLPGARLYRTGDRVRFLADGNVEFLGRLDHQVKIRGVRVEPGEIEVALAQHPRLAEAVVLAEQAAGGRRLVAYLVPVADGRVTVEDLGAFLRDRLPQALVPTVWQIVEEIPRSPSGKVDRRALAAQGGQGLGSERRYTAPRGPGEKALAEIWQRVLGLPRVGVYDNFFELGGDSILSIQIVARSAEAGLELRPRDLFQHQTVAELAAVAEGAAAPTEVEEEREAVVGEVPLGPIQHWFFEQGFADPHHFNQAVLLKLPRRPAPRVLHSALIALMERHDALRHRFVSEDDGWRQHAHSADGPYPLTVFDLAALPAARQRNTLERAAADVQKSLHLERGPLLRLVLFDLGTAEPPRLLLTLHHLVVDAVSWRILLEDLETAVTAASGPAPAPPRPMPVPFGRWTRRLAEYATSWEVRREIPFWTDAARRQVASLPVDRQGENTDASMHGVEVFLEAAVTRALLRQAPAAYRTEINDALLTALATTLSGYSGQPAVLVELEGHGREEIFPDLDLSHTVGWFTTLYPVLLDLRQVSPGSGSGGALKAIKEQLRQVPGRGLGYGLLRYLGDDDLRQQLANLPRPQVAWNYLGQLDRVLDKNSRLAAAEESVGDLHSPRRERGYLFELSASVVGGRLRVLWKYSTHLHRRSTVENLAESYLESLRDLVRHCTTPGVGGYTPSDLPLAGLDQRTLDRLSAEVDKGEIEDLYPLSPMQEGMLFHSLLAPEAEVYYQQQSLTFEEDLDAPALRQAWERAVENHPVLRTSFLFEGLERPLQRVHRRVVLPWREEDWGDLDAAEQESRLERELSLFRRRGFDLGRAPLMSIFLVRLAEKRWQFTWNFHHALLDGWSTPLLLGDVFALYGAAGAGQVVELPPRRPYREYIAWLEQRTTASGEPETPTAEARFWRRYLAGFSGATPLPGELSERKLPRAEGHFDTLRVQWPEQLQETLARHAREHRLTPGILLQGAWAVLLSRSGGGGDVVYGLTVSGRPAGLPGVESMTGLFINTLPVRVEVVPSTPLGHWLAALQEQQGTLAEYETTPLVRIQAWSEVGAGQPLFESLLVFDNLPRVGRQDVEEAPDKGKGDGADHSHGPRLRPRSKSFEKTNYPLALTVQPETLALKVAWDRQRLHPTAVHRMLDHLRRLLEAFAADFSAPLHRISHLSPAQHHQILVEWNDRRSDAIEETSMVDLFTDRAAKVPDAVAVTFEDGSLSYGELERRSRHLGNHLQTLGVAPEVPVGVCLERCSEILVAVLSIHRAGGAYLPLSPDLPAPRLAMFLHDTGAPVVLTRRSAEGLLGTSSARRVYLEPDGTLPVGLANSGGPTRRTQADQLAYVIYTSGSTGLPKGVGVPHRTALNFLHSMAHEPGLTSCDVLLAVTTLAFDISVLELFLPLAIGARVAMVSDGVVADGQRLARALAAQRATVMQATPTTWNLLLESGWCRPPELRVLSGGEALRRDLAQRLRGEGKALWNLYGPTETTVWSAVHPVRRGDGPVAIGRPIARTTIQVLDAHLLPVAAGTIAELWIGGEGLARGYLGRPALTAERFVPDPGYSTHSPGGRLYRTGDLARHRQDGTLECLGRIDHQVKIRGFRIEPQEIEVTLSQHPAVAAAVVMPRGAGNTGSSFDQRLVAYVESHDVTVDDTAELGRTLRRFLAESLPAYMVPARCVILDALPLLPSGKVDRRTLLETDAPVGGTAGVPPRDALELQLLGLFHEVLGTEAGISDNFFELGGHSLLAVRLMNRLHQVLGVELALSTLFEAPTVELLAAHMKQGGRIERSPLVAMRSGGSAPPFFCVHPLVGEVLAYAQLAQLLGPEQPFYGLQMPDLPEQEVEDPEAPWSSVEKLAAHYLEAVRTVEPVRPLLLGGHSFGGLVAFEMARQALALGQPVECLALLDTAAPTAEPAARPLDESEVVAGLLGGELLECTAEDLRRLPSSERLQIFLDLGQRGRLLPPGCGVGTARRLLDVVLVNARSAEGYRPAPYTGRVDLFHVDDTRKVDGWRQLATQVIRHAIPGTHHSLLQNPHVKTLAQRLARRLSGASQEEGPEESEKENS